MKKIYLIILFGLSYILCAQTVTVLNQDFEFGDVPPSGWINIDSDGDGKNWNIGSGSTYAHSGNFYARSYSRDNDGARTPNNWLITPKIQLNSEANLLKFWVASSEPNYQERFKVVLSTGSQSDTTDFSTILYSTTLLNGNWNEVTVNLTPYANKEVFIGFVHYNCTNLFYLRLDDISVISESDTDSPTVVDNTLSIFPANQNALINMKITDYSQIQSVVLYYKINNGETLNIPMTVSGDIYTAFIPGQDYANNASYYVVAKDVLNNTTTTSLKQIHWANQLWFDWGATYGNYGIGIMASSWKAAADFDFGSENYKIRKIESAMLNPENNCMWKFTGFDNVPLTNQLGDLSGFVNFTGGYTADIVDINSNTVISSKFAVVINSNGNWMQMDQQGPDNHTFIDDGDETFKLLTDIPDAANYHGSWHIRVFAEIDGSGIEEQEFIPGEIRIANYPNPFNPTTTIKFFNNCSGMVNLTVYNYKGQIVKELIRNKLGVGDHSVSFDGSRLASGVYIYRLQTPVKSLTGRMLLVK